MAAGRSAYRADMIGVDLIFVSVSAEKLDSGFAVFKIGRPRAVTEFIVYAMRNIASGGRIKDEDKLTEEEVKKVRERLKRLGYL